MGAVTVANRTPRAIVRLCHRKGVATEKLLCAVGIPDKIITDPGARVSAHLAFALWEEAQRRTRDGWIAGDTIESLPFGAYGIMDYLAAACSTPREALKSLIRHYRLVNGAFELQLNAKGVRSSLDLHNPYDSDGPSRLYVEFVFLALQKLLQFTTGLDWHPKEVHFVHPAYPGSAEYRQAFNCVVRFNQAGNRMLFDNRLLDIPQPQADPLLGEMMDHHAQRLLKQLPLEEDFLSDLRRALGDGLRFGDVSIKTTAQKMAMSCRALQRKLNAQGTSYSEVLDRLRHELAVDLLTHDQIGIEGLAVSLRFSEPSSFYRAFRRWTGKTPREYSQLLFKQPSLPLATLDLWRKQ
jgi:AraC-like DNA-binding protein